MSEKTLFDGFGEEPQEAQEPASGIAFPLALAALSAIRGLGSKSLKRLSAACGGDLGQLFKLPAGRIVELFASYRIPNLEQVAATVEQHGDQLIGLGRERLVGWEKDGVRIVPSARLGNRLRAANPDPPQWLFIRGDESLLSRRPAVAVVGTRTPTEAGLDAARRVVCQLAAYPVTIVSGLAEGIDDRAHQAALDCQMPNVAFLGHGINIVFPLATARTRERIIEEGGLLASEYLPDDHYQKSYFVERNRLQAALADLVIPVEARVSSGTAHTFRFARQYERSVLGVGFTGANGILDSVREAGYPVCDISTTEGIQALDRVVRCLTRQAGQDAYPFRQVERSILYMIREREPSQKDVKRLLDFLHTKLLDE